MYELKHFNIPKDKSPCIYGIINPIDMKIYIGATKNANKRAAQHKSRLKAGKHPSEEMQKDVNKGLRFFIIYKIPQNELKYIYIYEKIAMLNVLNSGFNLYNIVGAETKEKIKEHIISDFSFMFLQGYIDGIKLATGSRPNDIKMIKDKAKRFL